MRHSYQAVGFACALFLIVPWLHACRDDNASVPQQISAVERARTEWNQEQQRLQVMRDSLEVKVAENIEIGLAPDRARNVEVALIRSQEALVKASRLHFDAQTELLKLMQGK